MPKFEIRFTMADYFKVVFDAETAQEAEEMFNNEYDYSRDIHIGSEMLENYEISQLPPCAWCGAHNMDTHASFNAKDICIDCEEANLTTA